MLNDWKAVIRELKREPLHNTSLDFDNPEIGDYWQGDPATRGRVLSVVDWGNMVEFWHEVRNNLFHGGKDPSIKRDCFLVEYAYKTISEFMGMEIRLGLTAM